jgi:FlaA1/EpsC-like NDP-sugar epimerase
MFNKNLPGGAIFIIDLIVAFFSLTSAYLIRFNFSIPEIEIQTFYFVFPIVILVRAVSFYLFNTFSGIIKYTSTKDIQRILLSVGSGSAILALVNPVTFFIAGFFTVPYSIIIIEFLITFFLMSAFRAMTKILYYESMNPSREKTQVIIFGAGEAGVITKRTLDRDARRAA